MRLRNIHSRGPILDSEGGMSNTRRIRYDYSGGQTGFMNINADRSFESGVNGALAVRGHIGGSAGIPEWASGLVANEATVGNIQFKLLNHDIPETPRIGSKFHLEATCAGWPIRQDFTIDGYDKRTHVMTISRIHMVAGMGTPAEIRYDLSARKIVSATGPTWLAQSR